MLPEDREELNYLYETLRALKESLDGEQNPTIQAHLRDYIAEIERRIAAKGHPA